MVVSRVFDAPWSNRRGSVRTVARDRGTPMTSCNPVPESVWTRIRSLTVRFGCSASARLNTRFENTLSTRGRRLPKLATTRRNSRLKANGNTSELVRTGLAEGVGREGPSSNCHEPLRYFSVLRRVLRQSVLPQRGFLIGTAAPHACRSPRPFLF